MLEYAGKRGGKPSAKQRDISLRLIQLAREGKRVLRLKGGDPFVFGRGGEEALALVAAGVPFRIVPGHQRRASAASPMPAFPSPIATSIRPSPSSPAMTPAALVPDSVDWEALAKGAPVLVIYMALKHIEPIAERLMAAGRAPDEPVAVVSKATTAGAARARDTLAQRRRRVAASGIEPPALVVVGEVVRLRAGLDWLGALDGRALDRRSARPQQRSESGVSRGRRPDHRRPGLGQRQDRWSRWAAARCCARRGSASSAAKVGPDYIDPAFHAAAAGRPCLNLDPWAMRPATLARLLDRLGGDADSSPVEGVMGLFDGAADGTGSTADLAALTGWPVVLVVDARGQGASAGGAAARLRAHRADVAVAGVIFNRVGGAAHADALRRAAGAARPAGARLLAAQPTSACPSAISAWCRRRSMPTSRPSSTGGRRAGRARLDLTAARLARPARLAGTRRPRQRSRRRSASASPSPAMSPSPSPMPALLEHWRDAGAELVVLLAAGRRGAGGACRCGLSARRLSRAPCRPAGGQSAASSAGCVAAAARGAVLFGECGGYMVLGTGLIDADGTRHAMAGLLPLENHPSPQPRLHLGYRRRAAGRGRRSGACGAAFRGHEFHYATVMDEGAGEALFVCGDARGRALGAAGRRRGSVAGPSFI